MRKLSEVLGVLNPLFYKMDGTNKIDFFPAIRSFPLGNSAPDAGDITIRGVTHATTLYAEGETEGVSVELNHSYKNGGYCDIHLRFFPATNTSGTVNFTFNYYILKVDGTTVAGTSVNLETATIATNDYANSIGKYVNFVLNSTNFVNGDIIIGSLTRAAGTFSGDVAMIEIGLHGAVGKQGSDLATY